VLKPNGILILIDYTLEHPYIKELQSVEVPMTPDISNYHPMAHHNMLERIFDVSFVLSNSFWHFPLLNPP
jgi:hypothetical protein